MKKVASQYGLGRRAMFYKAQVWNTFFQDEAKKSISASRCTYRFDYFTDGYSWFMRALSADNPLEAIAYAETRYDELDRKYSARAFRKDITTQSLATAS